MSDKTKLHGLPIAVKKYAICAGCQTCLRLDENEKIVDGGPHYIAVEDITDEYISLVKNEPNNSINLTDEQIRQKFLELPLIKITSDQFKDEVAPYYIAGFKAALSLQAGLTCEDEGCPHYGTPHSHGKASEQEATSMPCGDEKYPLSAYIWRRESTQEWVLELSGTINDCYFTCRHTEPLSTPPEDVAELPSMHTSPPITTEAELVRKCAELAEWLKWFAPNNPAAKEKVNEILALLPEGSEG